VPTIRRIVECGIPVMGHIGLTPQSIHRFGGPKVQGRQEKSRAYLKESALALEEAGCFSCVLELLENDIATEEGFKPKFLREYANLTPMIVEAIGKYIDDVLNGRFPAEDESY